jgi:hypothetical protein
MMQTSLCRAFGAAVLFALAVVSCAGPQGSLDSAKRACDQNLKRLEDKSCDAYVAAALQSKDNNEIVRAYSYRALLREFRGDLPGALADTDQALAILPGDSFNSWRRAALVGKRRICPGARAVRKSPTVGFAERLRGKHSDE